MKILLSPAKNLSEKITNPISTNQELLFPQITKKISKTLKSKSVADLKSLMGLSDNLAKLNFERNQELGDKNGLKIPAIQAFQGEVYKGLDWENLNSNEQKYIIDNVFILSGLYGLLRPNDAIQAYRLEMGTKLPIEDKKNLYEVWRDKITENLNKTLEKGEILLNLASDEYSKVVDFKKIKANVVHIDFLDYKNGELKKIMVYLKHARGAFARYCAEKNVSGIEELRAAYFENYRLDQQKSTANHLVFTR